MAGNDIKDYQVERGLEDDVKDWIDDKVYSAGKRAYRGALDVMTTGFGKGLLITAAVAVTVTVAAVLISPATLLAPAAAAGSAGELIGSALTLAANFLTTQAGGIFLLGMGGAAGSLYEAHKENTDLHVSHARDIEALINIQNKLNATANAPSVTMDIQPDCRGGHCEQLLKSREHQMQATR